MSDGQIAIIQEWGNLPTHIGTVVQRYKNNLIAIGKESGDGWGDLFCCEDRYKNKNFMVEIIGKGSVLEID
jgi:hypothetical protein